MNERVMRWSPRLRLYVVGAALGVIPSLLALLATLFYAHVETLAVATLLQLLAWLCYCGVVLGALFTLGRPQWRWAAYGLLTIAVLTAILGYYDPLPHPSI